MAALVAEFGMVMIFMMTIRTFQSNSPTCKEFKKMEKERKELTQPSI
jgi:hypothetical protein